MFTIKQIPIIALALSLLAISPCPATPVFDLADLSLEELMDIKVELVARRPQRLAEVPAAAAVLTADEIRRAGARTIPDALRLVPGVQVARVDANKWAISARGFNGLFSNKLLVLIDGRTVYSPLFSGVFWEAQDVVLDDIERIEVIRGPGGTLWGANAVNGIINIVTRSAAETQGALVEVLADYRGEHRTTVRHGGALSSDADYRVYARYTDYAASSDGDDDWRVVRGGARLDWRLSARDELTLQGDFYDGKVGQTFRLTSSFEPPYVQTTSTRSPVAGANALARWQHSTGDSDLHLQIYYDHSERDDLPLIGSTDVFDIDFQQHRRARQHELVWGWGYRRNADSVEGSFALAFDPTAQETHLFSVFAQDQMPLVGERLRLIVGSKIERNSYTGWEWQPGARLLWRPRTAVEQTLWLALTRAVRTPSRSDADIRITTQVLPPDALGPGAPTSLIALVGDRGVEAEDLIAVEAGFRAQSSEKMRYTLSAFYNIYSDLRSSETSSPEFRSNPTPHLYIPLRTANRLDGRTYGAELTADWQALRTWQLRAAYSLLYIDLELEPSSADELAVSQERESPRQQWVLRSLSEPHPDVQFDLTWRYVGALPVQSIAAYSTLDVHLGWALKPGLLLQLVTRDLFSSPRREFNPLVASSLPTRIGTTTTASLRWQF